MDSYYFTPRPRKAKKRRGKGCMVISWMEMIVGMMMQRKKLNRMVKMNDGGLFCCEDINV